MTVNIEENVIRVVILDISGTYIQIYDQGYFDKNSIEDVKKKYSDMEHWSIIVLD